jgi:hypothetical protein
VCNNVLNAFLSLSITRTLEKKIKITFRFPAFVVKTSHKAVKNNEN